MKCKVQKIGECRVRLQVEVEVETFENYYQEVLKSFQKNARLPGFREGRAPTEMVEKKFSAEVCDEAIKSLIPDAYHQSVEKEKLNPVSLPKISDIRHGRGKPLAFTAEFDREPEFNVKNYKGIKLRRMAQEVNDDEVEKGLSALVESRAEFRPVEEPERIVGSGDYILADVEIWREGHFVPGKKNVLLTVEKSPADDFFEKVVGARVDEVREIVAKAAPAPSEGPSEGAPGQEAHPSYKIWIRQIQEKKLPAIDDALAKTFGKEDLASLRDAVRKDIASHKRNEGMEKMKAELFDKLLGLYQFALPESLVEKQQKRLIEQAKRQAQSMGMTEAHFEKERERFTKESQQKAESQVRLYFILQKIAAQENLEADETELETRLAAISEESKRPLEEVRRVFEEDLRESQKEKKTVDFLLANANLTDESK